MDERTESALEVLDDLRRKRGALDTVARHLRGFAGRTCSDLVTERVRQSATCHNSAADEILKQIGESVARDMKHSLFYEAKETEKAIAQLDRQIAERLN